MARFITLILSTLLISSLASAQDTASRPLTYTFEDTVVPAERVRPELERILTRSRTQKRSLIVPRLHFVTELANSIRAL